MGLDRAVDSAGQARRAPARGGCARGDERGSLCSGDRLPVARAAEGPAAEVHGARLSHAVGLGRHAGARPSRALPHDPGVRRPRGLAQRRGDRQPERERRGKRGARIDPPGYDAGKKVKGKKRHLLVDTLGLILAIAVHPADLQDRDGALLVLDHQTRRLFPFLETIFADGAYGGQKLRRAMADAASRIEVVKGSAKAKGFEVFPRRWVVERSQRDGVKRIAWINRCRRLAKDYENLNRTAIAFIRLASIRLMLRRLTRYCYPS